MCITFFVFKNSPEFLGNKYRLIILNNRDEFFKRKTLKLSWEKQILAGIDVETEARGTWFGINKCGNIGILLSITEPKSVKKTEVLSRGQIVMDYLKNNYSLNDYLHNLSMKSNYDLYNGFQFLGFERNSDGNYQMGSITNSYVKNVNYDLKNSGIYGYGNSPWSKPFKKVIYGKELFNNLINSFDFKNRSEKELIEELLSIGKNDKFCFPDNQIKLQTASSGDEYKPLCSLFVRFPLEANNFYGTRSHSILLIDKYDNVTFFEERMIDFPLNIETAKWEKTIHKFNINKFNVNNIF